MYKELVIIIRYLLLHIDKKEINSPWYEVILSPTYKGFSDLSLSRGILQFLVNNERHYHLHESKHAKK